MPSAHQASGAGSQESVVVVCRNPSEAACSMKGYPLAWFVDAAGARIGPTSIRESTPPPTTVALRPGDEASTTVWTGSPDVPTAAQCQPTTAAAVRVVPPGQSSTLSAVIRITICAKGGVVGTPPIGPGGPLSL